MAKRIIINFCPEGEPVSDFYLEKWLDDLFDKFEKSQKSIEVKASNELMVEYSRLLVVRDKLKYNQLVFKFKEKLCHLNNYCEFIDEPPLLNTSFNCHVEVVKYSLNERLKRKK